jgi:TolA-binding protein
VGTLLASCAFAAGISSAKSAGTEGQVVELQRFDKEQAALLQDIRDRLVRIETKVENLEGLIKNGKN